MCAAADDDTIHRDESSSLRVRISVHEPSRSKPPGFSVEDSLLIDFPRRLAYRDVVRRLAGPLSIDAFEYHLLETLPCPGECRRVEGKEKEYGVAFLVFTGVHFLGEVWQRKPGPSPIST